MQILSAIKQKVNKFNKKSRIVITVLAVLFLAGASFGVYAKYYKTGYNKGMAVASGFYFSSNYMAVHDDIRELSMEEIAANYINTIIASENDWQGSVSHAVPVEIRNYDSQLLFNDDDLSVGYQVNFMLLDEPAGADYSVKFGDVTKPLGFNNGKGTVVSFTGTLPGGMLSADGYELSVTKTGAAEYVPSNILMVAYPTDPSYLKGTRCIAGIIKIVYVEKEFKIESSGFAISKTDTWNDSQWKDNVSKESGFIYELITSGNYTGSDTTATRKRIQLKWDSSIFKINANDKYYLSVKDTANYYTMIEDGITWQVMEIDVLPYASIRFVLFRNDDFETKIKNMTKEQFENSVQVKVL